MKVSEILPIVQQRVVCTHSCTALLYPWNVVERGDQNALLTFYRK